MNKKVVKVTCYGKTETMTRKDAIKAFREAVEWSDGCERERYMNILMDLYDGKDNCSDREEY